MTSEYYLIVLSSGAKIALNVKFADEIKKKIIELTRLNQLEGAYYDNVKEDIFIKLSEVAFITPLKETQNGNKIQEAANFGSGGVS